MPAYRKMLNAERAATVGFVPRYRRLRPAVPVVKAKREAAVNVTSFRTRGLLRVRVIRASYLGSKSMFRVFAEAEERKVPVVKYANVRVDADKVVEEARLAVVVRMSGMG